MTQSNTNRTIGACAAVMLMESIGFAGEAQGLWSVFAHGSSSDIHTEFFEPFTKPYFLLLAATGLLLAIPFLISPRRLFWFVLVWVGLDVGSVLAGFVGDIRYDYQSWYGAHSHLPPGTSMFGVWAWAVIPLLFPVVPRIILLVALLGSRTNIVQSGTHIHVA